MSIATEYLCDRCGADVPDGAGHYTCDNGERLCGECITVHDCDACQGARLDQLTVGDRCPWNCVATLVAMTVREPLPGRRGRWLYFEVAQCPGCGWHWVDGNP